MNRIIAAVALLALPSALAPARAQVPTLPETSRAEAQTNAISRSLEAQSQNRAAAQQNQFEINSLRTQNSMRPFNDSAAPPVVAPLPGRR